VSIDSALYPLSDYKVSGLATLVDKYIMATHHTMLMKSETYRVSLCQEEKYISDMDLYGFALPWKQFIKNNGNIRKEFTHLTDTEFINGQKKFLEGILKLETIYLTEFFGRFEKTARENIESLILSFNNQ
jgi:predicted metal-dependent HD superfamily phosphohydrolase